MALNLVKGQKVDLKKETGEKLESFCVGVNWGMIESFTMKEVLVSEGFFGFGRKSEFQKIKQYKSVDLDLSCILIDDNDQFCDYLYSPLWKKEVLDKYKLPEGKLVSMNGSLKHSGDDLDGDEGGDDGLDNEIISINLKTLPPNVDKIFFFLNNVGEEDFSQIPYAKIRMYEGGVNFVKSVFASYNVSSETTFKNNRAIIMGKLYKRDNQWKFDAIGDATDDVFFGQTIYRILQNYL